MSSEHESEADPEAGVEANDEMPGAARNFDVRGWLQSHPPREPWRYVPASP